MGAAGPTRVAVLFDGLAGRAAKCAHERCADESVIRDAALVRAALAAGGYRAVLIPLARSIRHFLARVRSFRPDAVFNLCEGAMGSSRCEMHVCALLELAGLRATGCGPLALGVAQDKALAKSLLLSSRIPTPRYLIDTGGVPPAPPQGMRYPLFVKPAREDASIGIDGGAFVRDRAALASRCRFVRRRYRQPALVEEYIEGRELAVAVIGNDRPVPLPVSEIEMRGAPGDGPRVCDYRAKWAPGSDEYARTVPVCPAALSRRAEKAVTEIACEAYRALSCRGYARVDIRLSREGTPWVLEVNPNPCIAPDAGLARAAAAAGLSYTALIVLITELALRGDEALRGLSRRR